MGSNTSKSNNESMYTEKNEIEIGESNPDPRSPTPEITRTPLHNKNGAKHNITKNMDLRKTFENGKGDEKLIHNNPILSAVIKNHLQSYDPRSPTQDFERTPIIIASKIDELTRHKLSQLQNNHNYGSPSLRNGDDDECDESYIEAVDSPELVVPKNLCDGFFDMTLNETINDSEEPLGSSTVSSDAIENNVTDEANTKRLTLLETNFDYIENDIDKEDNKEDIQTTHLYNDNKKHIFKLDDDPRSPTTEIERTPILVSKVDESIEENVEAMSDDTLIKVLQSTNSELHQVATKPQDMKPEGLLIYEDESATLNDTPKKSKSGCDSGARTPLSCMKNKSDTGHARSKSANMLYDPKSQKIVPSKIPKRSYIPRLKSLSKQTQLVPTGSSVSLKNICITSTISGDCENTPPQSHRDKWDKDNSIVL